MWQALCGRQELVERERAMEKCVERSDIHTGIDNIFRLHSSGGARAASRAAEPSLISYYSFAPPTS